VADADKIVEVKFDADTQEFLRKLRQADQQSDLSAKNIGKAFKQVQNSGQIASLAFSALKLPLVFTGLNLVASAGAAAAGGLFALGSSIAPVSGLMGAFPGLVLAGAQSLGVFALAFKGVGAALKADTKLAAGAAKANDDLTKRTIALAKEQTAAAKQIKSATRALKEAREAAADSAVDNAESIKKAEQRVIDSQERLRKATVRVTKARFEATKQIAKMRRAIEDSSLSQERASLDLDEARKALQDLNIANDMSIEGILARREAIFAVNKAESDLRQAQEDRKTSVEDLLTAESKGIDGSDQVQNALEDVSSAQDNAKDAAQDLAKAQVDSAKAQVDAAQRIADAQERLADSVANQAEVQAKSAEKTSAALSSLQNAMDNLSPAGKNFVGLLKGMRPEFDKMKFSAQEGLLPGVGEALVKVSALFPLLNKVLFTTGQTFGNLAKESANLVASPAFSGDLDSITQTNNRNLTVLGRAMLQIVDGFRQVAFAAQPLTERLSASALSLATLFAESAKAGRESGKLAAFFDRAANVGSQLNDVFKNLAVGLYNIGKVSNASLGDSMLQGIVNLTNRFREWTASVAGQTRITKFFDDMKVNLAAAGRLVAALSTAFGHIVTTGDTTQLASFLDMLTALVPKITALLDKFKGQITQDMIDGFKKLAEVFIEIFSQTGSLEAFIDILSGVASVIRVITDNPIGAEVFSGLTYLFIGSKILDRIPLLGLLKTKLLGVGSAAVAGGLRSVAYESVGLSGKIANFAKNLGSSAVAVAKHYATMVADGARWVAATAAQGAKAAATGIAKFASSLATAAVSVTKSFATMIAAGAKWVLQQGIQVASAIANYVRMAVAAMVQGAIAAAGTMLPLLPWIALGALIALVVYAIIKNWDSIVAAAKWLWEKTKEWLGKLIGWIKDAFLNFTPQGRLIKHWDDVVGAAKWLFEKVKEWAGKLVGFLRDAFLNFTPLGLLIKHWQDIVGWAKWLFDSAVNIFQGLIKFFFQTVPDWISRGASNLYQFFLSFGRNIMQSLANGVAGAWDILKNIWNRIIDWLPGSFADGLKIASPSKIMVTIGQQVASGLAKGITDGIPKIEAAVGGALGAINGTGALTATVAATAGATLSKPSSAMLTPLAASQNNMRAVTYVDNTNVTVQGSVITERDLANRMRSLQLEKGRANVNVGLS